jgi:glycosyltransferase involved in cell wall biosynthesis
VGWAEVKIVLDSGSTDRTGEVACEHGAEVVQFRYQSPWPKKKEWALRNLPFRNDWVLLLDADEVFSADAAEEIGRIVQGDDGGCAGFWINRRFLFMGRWLRHAYYPNWNLRLVKHRLAHFERLTEAETESGDVEIHEHLLVEGATGRLRCEMDHYAFPDIASFVEKHNRYSNWEAVVQLDFHKTGEAPALGAVRWRRLLKKVSHRLPCRPFLRFVYVYVIQRGFLDGWEGYIFARLHAWYEWMCVLKARERRQRQSGSRTRTDSCT